MGTKIDTLEDSIMALEFLLGAHADEDDAFREAGFNLLGRLKTELSELRREETGGLSVLGNNTLGLGKL